MTPATGTTSTWEMDPDEGNATFATSVPVTTFGNGLTATTALAEMATPIAALRGTATPNAEVVTTSILPADVTNVADTPANITFQLDNGEGPVGGFNANTYTGGTTAVTTGIDLVNNEGMLWIIPADTGGSGVLMGTIFDTSNFMDGVAPNFLQTANRNSQGNTISGEGINRFTTTGWENSDFSGGSLNRTGDLNTQLSFAVTPDLFAMVDYTGAAGPNGDGTAAPHTIPHTLGSVPGAILIKRTGVAPFGQSDWVFYHKDVFANNDVGYFNFSGQGPSNDTNNPSHFNGTHPTASVFTVGNSVGSQDLVTQTVLLMVDISLTSSLLMSLLMVVQTLMVTSTAVPMMVTVVALLGTSH